MGQLAGRVPGRSGLAQAASPVRGTGQVGVRRSRVRNFLRCGKGWSCGIREGAKNRGVDSIGKTLVLIGLAIALAGAVLWWSGRNGGGFLPGDIVLEKRNVRFYFPIATSIVVSLILTLLLWLWRR